MGARNRRIRGLALMGLAAAGAGGCAAAGHSRGPDEAALADLYGPRKLEVLPFTKPRSFDPDAVPDGIEVALRPLDEMGDPVKAYGTFLFELFRWRDASGDRAGDRLETWTQAIGSAADQRRFWDRMTSTYTFQLTWESGAFPAPDHKYLLRVSFQPPGGERLFADYPFTFRVDRPSLRAEAKSPAG